MNPEDEAQGHARLVEENPAIFLPGFRDGAPSPKWLVDGFSRQK